MGFDDDNKLFIFRELSLDERSSAAGSGTTSLSIAIEPLALAWTIRRLFRFILTDR